MRVDENANVRGNEANSVSTSVGNGLISTVRLPRAWLAGTIAALFQESFLPIGVGVA